jgi:hypothetical protein
MATETNFAADVLHSTNHSQLSPEEIAKAVARHNHKHPAGAQNVRASAKTNKGRKG